MMSKKGLFEADQRPASCWLFLILWAAAAVPELVLHIATAGGNASVFNIGLLLPTLFALVPALIGFALLQLIPSKALRLALAIFYCIVMFLLCGSQQVYYSIFGCFYSAYSMANGGGAFQFWNTILVGLWRNLLPLLLMVLPTVFTCIFGHRLIGKGGVKPVLGWILPTAAAVLVQILLVLSLPLFGGTGTMSPYDLYHNTSDSYYNVNRLGLLTAFRLDLTRFATGNQNNGTIQLNSASEPSETAFPEDTTAATSEETTAPEEIVSEPTEPLIDTSPNILSLDFDQLIATASDTQIQELHQYFSNRTASSKNEKTGIFSGCNLILITAEAFSASIVDPQRTPTLYKMMHEGFYFTDYYVPDWGTSTTDGEYAFLTGTIPKANTWSFSDSSDNAMPLTMAQQLIAQGYSAYAYHGHTYNYYNRNEYLENLGYTYRAYKQGLDVDYTWPESDVQVVDLTTSDYVTQEPFTAYYMTISGHREFNFYGNYIAMKNQSLVEDEPYSEAVRAYIATQLELEQALTLLMDRLEDAGVLENTVFVLTADHYPNGLTNEQISELLGHSVETNFELYKNGCIIYKPGMTPETIDTPCSHLDLLPTLSNLFGLEFDSRLYMGRDVFSDAEPLVMFRNRSWITDLGSYNYLTGEVTNSTEYPMSDTYISNINAEVSNRFTVSSRILDYDYWSILFPDF